MLVDHVPGQLRMLLQSQRVLVFCLRRFSPPPTARFLSSSAPVLVRRQDTGRGEKLLPPEERLGYLRSAEKRVAVFAGISLIVGYFALKTAFFKMSSKQEEQAKEKAELSKSTLPRPLVVAGPSGSGKSTLLTRLFKENPNKFGFSVSHTTRKPRPGEVDGKEYHFTTRESMQKGIDGGAFIEWAEYSGNMYGTSKKSVRDVQMEGRVCVLDIDMQGVRSLKETDLNPVYVLICSPSMEVLEKRLRSRKTESEESLQKRLAVAREELSYAEGPGVFDHVVINDTLETAYADFVSTIGKYVKLRGDETKSEEPKS